MVLHQWLVMSIPDLDFEGTAKPPAQKRPCGRSAGVRSAALSAMAQELRHAGLRAGAVRRGIRIYNFNWGYYLHSLQQLAATATRHPFEPTAG